MPDKIITRLDLIRQLARKRERSDLSFRMWVKRSNLTDEQLDGLVSDTAREVERQIDCTTCGNCCRTLQVVVDDADIRRLAKELCLPAPELERRYVRRAPDGTKHIVSPPCPFLEGNRCSVYEARPKACRDFPYLHEKGFRSRMLILIEYTAICPIVFNTYAQLKEKSGFRKDGS